MTHSPNFAKDQLITKPESNQDFSQNPTKTSVMTQQVQVEELKAIMTNLCFLGKPYLKKAQNPCAGVACHSLQKLTQNRITDMMSELYIFMTATPVIEVLLGTGAKNHVFS